VKREMSKGAGGSAKSDQMRGAGGFVCEKGGGG
jgi:hypothetical protein